LAQVFQPSVLSNPSRGDLSVQAITMAARTLTLIVFAGLSLLSMAVASESCSTAMGTCESLDNAAGTHVSLVQKNMKLSMDIKGKRNHVKDAWLGTCPGTSCPPAYAADQPCPSDCASVTGTTGACSGTDDIGKTCSGSFDLSTDTFCPNGCTVTVDASDDTTTTTTTTVTDVEEATEAETFTLGGFTFTTSNSNSYMCSSDIIKEQVASQSCTVACGQGQYKDGVTEAATVTCSSGTISCFVFASFGATGGSCAGDEFYDGDVAYVPEVSGTACQGMSTCTSTPGEASIDGITVDRNDGKLKLLALCED